ncbi:MAG TPA: phosphoglycerate dehydrogenase [Candidatus Ventricola intestinavium]|nr:phosphoglycerate dehydrogenase [Candidatus Ventricola intestinavium]
MNVLMGIPNWRMLIKENAAARLMHAGFHLVVNGSNAVADRAFLEENIACADAMIAGGERIDSALLSRAERLRVIARYGVGTDNIDIECATRMGIYVTSTMGANANAVAEHALALMLAVQRRIGYYDRAVRQGSWTSGEFPELSGKCVGLIGFGHIGRLVARRLSGFEVRLLVCDPYQSGETIRAGGGRPCTLEELLGQSDIVSLHLPATKENEHLIDARRLAGMKRGAFLINTSRGALVDEQALREALLTGQIAGAGLDVLRQEPMRPDHPLFRLDNVLVTPHVAGGSYENHRKAGEMCVQAVLDGLAGIRPVNAVNRPDRERSISDGQGV